MSLILFIRGKFWNEGANAQEALGDLESGNTLQPQNPTPREMDGLTEARVQVFTATVPGSGAQKQPRGPTTIEWRSHFAA